jgi:hypothetical protein
VQGILGSYDNKLTCRRGEERRSETLMNTKESTYILGVLTAVVENCKNLDLEARLLAPFDDGETWGRSASPPTNDATSHQAPICVWRGELCCPVESIVETWKGRGELAYHFEDVMCLKQTFEDFV